ncbi:hypothetical protein C0993_008523 [Termitomyces sp. T159_Od127]|nr:hypothetical protein C0993_008523 [Termitomyces sp. T159_Od127]
MRLEMSPPQRLEGDSDLAVPPTTPPKLEDKGPNPRETKFKFMFNGIPVRSSESSKRPHTLSPLKGERNPKRRTSALNPAQAQEWHPNNSPRSHESTTTTSSPPQNANNLSHQQGTPVTTREMGTPKREEQEPQLSGQWLSPTPLPLLQPRPRRSTTSKLPHAQVTEDTNMELDQARSLSPTPLTTGEDWDEMMEDIRASLTPITPSNNRATQELSRSTGGQQRNLYLTQRDVGMGTLGQDRDVRTPEEASQTKEVTKTARPNGGWPKMHLVSSPLENVADSQVLAWNKVKTAKLWARIFRAKYEQNSLATVDKTRELIKSLIHIEDDVSLGMSFPQQKRHIDSDRFPLPYHMLISGLSREQVEHLIALEVVATTEVTVIFKPFEDQRPTFVMTISGLTYTESPGATQAVIELVHEHILDTKEIIQLATECSQAPRDQAIVEIMDNITAKYIKVK